MLINKELLDLVSKQAKENERLRKNYNFHESLDSPSQRLLNAMEIGTKIPIHCHNNTDETYIILRGKIRLKLYNDKGEIIDNVILDNLSGNYGYNIEKNQWHSLEVLESGTIIFESKDGPYKTLDDNEILNK